MGNRREFLWAVTGFTAVHAAFADDGPERIAVAARAVRGRTAADLARDEDFWREIQQAFTVDRSLVNLNNGGVSPSPRVVQEAMKRYLDMSHLASSHYLWRVLEPQVETVRARLARHFGCDGEEMAITRNASESLETCLLGLDLAPGDEILTTTQDYPRMLTAIDQRVRRENVAVRKIELPPAERGPEAVVAAFAEAITPRTRVILLCHIINLTGRILPVREVCRMARARGIEVVVDGAHAFAHFAFRRDDLECDYYGVSLHKWLMAPHGTGFLYVRRGRIEKLWPLMAAPEKMNADIRKFEEIGTHPAANHNAIAEALTFHEGIGIERKEARLRLLRARWEERFRGRDRVTLRTPEDPRASAGIANIHIDGLEPSRLATWLWDRHKIIVTPIDHPAVSGIRVTPGVYTTLEEVDRFGDALEKALAEGLPA